MKKLATLITLILGAGFAFGQAIQHNAGIISFVNTESGKHLVTNSAGVGIVGTQYKAELYYEDPNNANALTPVAATISSFKSTTVASSSWGTWNGPTTPVSLPTTATPGNPSGIGGVDVDTTQQNAEAGVDAAGYTSPNGDGLYPVLCVVRAWDSTTGATYETATSRGQSALFTYTQRSSVPASPADIQMVNQKPFLLVPEPSAIALSIFGVAGLLLIRRRK